jgi:hypothetical protein
MAGEGRGTAGEQERKLARWGSLQPAAQHRAGEDAHGGARLSWQHDTGREGARTAVSSRSGAAVLQELRAGRDTAGSRDGGR